MVVKGEWLLTESALSGGERTADLAMRLAAWSGAFAVLVLVAFLVIEIGGQAVPAIRVYGLGFITRTTWNASTHKFRVLPEIWGTLASSLLALVLGGLFGVSIAIFLPQDFLDYRLAKVFRTMVEMLAAIPSVVFGLWGIFVVIPALKPSAAWLYQHVGWFPPFGTELAAPGTAPTSFSRRPTRSRCMRSFMPHWCCSWLPRRQCRQP